MVLPTPVRGLTIKIGPLWKGDLNGCGSLICELPGDTYPKASPGFGKRAGPGEHRDADAYFAHLPPREASIAAYLDRLPEGADISVKTLARMTPYGQCALRTALQLISEAGHLRRGRETVLGVDGSYHHVTRTYSSRTAHDDAWWEAYARGESPSETSENTGQARSRAYRLLAGLGRGDALLTMGAASARRWSRWCGSGSRVGWARRRSYGR